jgi:hypothetical protein
MSKYQSIEEVATHYGSAMEDETAAAFLQGKILAEAIESGFKAKEVVTACVGRSRMKYRTVCNRLKVYRAFGDDWNPQVTWYTHLLAAGTDNPREWLERAVDENMSTRQLQNAIGNRPQVYLKNTEGVLWKCQARPDIGGNVIEIFVPGELPTMITPHTDVVITLVQANAQEVAA